MGFKMNVVCLSSCGEVFSRFFWLFLTVEVRFCVFCVEDYVRKRGKKEMEQSESKDENRPKPRTKV